MDKHAVSENHATTEFDIARSIQWCLFDMVCRIGMGRPLGFIANHSDTFGFQQTLEERLPIVEKFAALTEVNRLISLISKIHYLRGFLPSPHDKSGIGAVMGAAAKVVEEQYNNNPAPYRIGLLDAWQKNGVGRKEAMEELTIAL